jgi:ferrochelatase
MVVRFSADQSGKQNLVFSVDCLETLEEIAVEGKETFLQAGGESYHYIPALNADPGYMQTLATLIRRWQNSIQC